MAGHKRWLPAASGLVSCRHEGPHHCNSCQGTPESAVPEPGQQNLVQGMDCLQHHKCHVRNAVMLHIIQILMCHAASTVELELQILH